MAVRDEKLKQAQTNLRRVTDTHHSMSTASQDGCSALFLLPQCCCRPLSRYLHAGSRAPVLSCSATTAPMRAPGSSF